MSEVTAPESGLEEEEVVLQFEWGKKRGMGGKKRDVQFYESFTFDGVEYALFDAVYHHNEGEPEPYIGKLIKIWENRDKSKKVKVQWFFRPREIQRYLEGIQTRHNELFLGCGEGKGLTNINPLVLLLFLPLNRERVLCVLLALLSVFFSYLFSFQWYRLFTFFFICGHFLFSSMIT